jgi:hypothetical protein
MQLALLLSSGLSGYRRYLPKEFFMFFWEQRVHTLIFINPPSKSQSEETFDYFVAL